MKDSDFHKKHLVIGEDTIKDFEVIKTVTVQKLVDEGLLDEKAASLFCETFGVLVFKHPWYKSNFKDPDGERVSVGLFNLKEIEKQ